MKEITKDQLAEIFRRLGVQPGDGLLVHSAVQFLGKPVDGLGMVLDALMETVGEKGTIAVPAFNFGFARGEPFDPQDTRAEGMGAFSEFVRQQPTARRTPHPMQSLVVLGWHADDLASRDTSGAFDPGSPYERMLELDFKILLLGADIDAISMIHYSEQRQNVPYRYWKEFQGQVRTKDGWEQRSYQMFVRDLRLDPRLTLHSVQTALEADHAWKTEPVNYGRIASVRITDFVSKVDQFLENDPYSLWIRRGMNEKVNDKPSEMIELIEELWQLKRDIVSDDYDRALFRLKDELGSPTSRMRMMIHEYPTGEACWTWRIPEKWACHEAYLETLDGHRLVDAGHQPLHVVSYSLPFEGIVSREDLLPHLHVHPRLPDAIPFVFKYYQRDWGLCLPARLYDTLTDDRYRVVIRTSFEPGALKVGEVVIPGQSEQTFVLAAHLCHPAMVNDDLTGVVAGLDVMRRLAGSTPLFYTYRFLIFPETIGSVAYLSHHEDLIPKMVGGLFLEMLGNDSPHALQGSFQPDSQADRCLGSALRGLAPNGYQGTYRTIIDNDERQFNAPGVRVPMLSLSRVEAPKSSGRPPYPEYHSSFDTPEIVSQQRLEESRELILGLIEAFERNQYVVNNFKGEIFCSGYGIWIDYTTNPDGHRRLFEIMERCDGEHTVADIACKLNISFQSAWEIVHLLEEKDLVWLSRVPVSTSPHAN